MTRMKIRDRENRKILTGFRDMAGFVTGNRDPIHPGGPLTRKAQNIVTDILFISINRKYFC